MKLALALVPSPDELLGVDSLDGLDVVESEIVLLLNGAAELLDVELRLAAPWPCLFKRGRSRLSPPPDPDVSSGRSVGDTV
jgi:hypothetical protein